MSSPSAAAAEERIVRAIREGSDRLDLGGLGLKAVPPLPDGLRGLLGLDLSGNRLKALSPDVAALAGLKWLDLGNNRLETFPPEIADLCGLVSLDLSENRLAALPESIGRLARLVELSLYDNVLVDVAGAIAGLGHLERLDLAANRLRSLPTFGAGLGRLKVLDLSDNLLDAAPAGLDLLVSLRVLSLAGNRLATSAGIEALTALEELDLSGNLLADPPEGAARLPHLRVLEVGGNPFGAVPEAMRGVTGEDRRALAEAAVLGRIVGGPQPDTRYFEPVAFLFACTVAVGGLGGLCSMIDLYYKRFHGDCSVTLEFPGGTKVLMPNLTRKKALELAREHEDELAQGEARLDLGEALRQGELARKTDFAVSVLTRIPGSSLVPKAAGAAAIQFVTFNGPVFNPVLQGPSAKEEVMFGDKIEIKDVQNSIITVKSTMEQVVQTLGTAPIDASKKHELNALVQELGDAIGKVPADKAEDAGAVADAVKEAMDKLAKPHPNKASLQLSAKGMVEAAQGLADVLPIAMKIATTIAGMFSFAV